ncbi:MAG: molybdopterin-dependent oxidoreductase [Actinomycetota bacterium]
MKARWRVSGLLAGGLALSFLWAASRVDGSIPFPPLNVAERIIRLTPGGVATFFIDILGHNALRLLTAGTVLAFLVLSTVLPEASRARGAVRPTLAGAALGAAAAGAALADPTPPHPVAALLTSAGAGILYAVCLAWLTEAAPEERHEQLDRSRRRALALVGTAAAAIALGGTALGRLARRLAGPDTDVPIRAPDEAAATPSRPLFPRIHGLSPEVTSAADHYVVDIDLLDPVVEADGWTLTVGGLVERPLTITFSQLQRDFTLVEEYSVLTCISNEVGGGLVGSSSWIGVRLGEVLGRARLREGAVDVVLRCADGYAASLPVETALDPGAILAIAQNRRPLTQEHGFPCRLRVPALYGVKNAKWVEEIEVVASEFRDYWTRRGWSETAVVRTQSRIDAVGSEIRAGEAAWIAGLAWAGARGIARVEVSVDAGATWAPARMNLPLSPLAWTQWAYRWVPQAPGTHLVLSRAFDGLGAVQDPATRPPHPSGASGYHQVDVRVS